MLNQVMLVGRLVDNVKVEKLESGKEVAKLTLAVNRSYKNAEGIYETDFVDCILWDGIANNVSEYCRKGDVVGLRGRLQTTMIGEEDNKRKVMEVVAEKVTFLSSKSNEIQNDIDKKEE